MNDPTPEGEDIGKAMRFFAPFFWCFIVFLGLGMLFNGFVSSQTKKTDNVRTAELARDVEALFSDIERYYEQHDNYYGIDEKASHLLLSRLASPHIASSPSSGYLTYQATYSGLSEESCLALGIKGVQKLSTVNINGTDVVDWFKVVKYCRGGDEVRFTSLPKSVNEQPDNPLVADPYIPAPIVQQKVPINVSIACQFKEGDEVLYRGKSVTIMAQQGNGWYRIKNEYGETMSKHKEDMVCR